MKVLIMQFSSVFGYLPRPTSKYLPQQRIPEDSQASNSYPYETTGKCMLLCVF
jgi:hypothetical protein